MGTPATTTALCAAVPIEGDGAPEWLHLLPAGEVRTNDGRGPYRSGDLAALMAQSLKAAGGKLVLDENHATDLAAPKGGSAPARAWIVELQQRADGVWGKAQWTPTGRQLMEAGEYRGISPVIAHRKDGTITAILRASLTNTPNLQGLKALHSASREETDMDFKAMVIEALGLDAGADDDAIAAAIKTRLTAPADEKPALQAALAPIAKAVGLADDAGADAILVSVQSLQGGGNDAVKALQSTVQTLSGKLESLTEAGSRERATGFVDKAIADGKVGVKPLRDHYITMHMANPENVEKIFGALPDVRAGAMDRRDPQAGADEDNAVELSRHATEYQLKLAGAGTTIDFATAVQAVREGKHK